MAVRLDLFNKYIHEPHKITSERILNNIILSIYMRYCVAHIILDSRTVDHALQGTSMHPTKSFRNEFQI